MAELRELIHATQVPVPSVLSRAQRPVRTYANRNKSKKPQAAAPVTALTVVPVVAASAAVARVAAVPDVPLVVAASALLAAAAATTTATTTTTAEPEPVVAPSVRLPPVDLMERLIFTLENTMAALGTMTASLDRFHNVIVEARRASQQVVAPVPPVSVVLDLTERQAADRQRQRQQEEKARREYALAVDARKAREAAELRAEQAHAEELRAEEAREEQVSARRRVAERVRQDNAEREAEVAAQALHTLDSVLPAAIGEAVEHDDPTLASVELGAANGADMGDNAVPDVGNDNTAVGADDADMPAPLAAAATAALQLAVPTPLTKAQQQAAQRQKKRDQMRAKREAEASKKKADAAKEAEAGKKKALAEGKAASSARHKREAREAHKTERRLFLQQQMDRITSTDHVSGDSDALQYIEDELAELSPSPSPSRADTPSVPQKRKAPPRIQAPRAKRARPVPAVTVDDDAPSSPLRMTSPTPPPRTITVPDLAGTCALY